MECKVLWCSEAYESVIAIHSHWVGGGRSCCHAIEAQRRKVIYQGPMVMIAPTLLVAIFGYFLIFCIIAVSCIL